MVKWYISYQWFPTGNSKGFLMIPVKVQCGCGQRYTFEVEPVNGKMSYAVACPICGADGTAAANEIIAHVLAVTPSLSSAPPSAAAPRLHMVASVPHTPPPPPPSMARAMPALPVGPAKLAWYDQIWIALPIALVAVGGAIGGGCGGLAWGINKAVFQKTRNPVLRYVWTGLISGASVVLWLVVAMLVVSLIKKH